MTNYCLRMELELSYWYRRVPLRTVLTSLVFNTYVLYRHQYIVQKTMLNALGEDTLEIIPNLTLQIAIVVKRNGVYKVRKSGAPMFVTIQLSSRVI